MLTAKTSNSTTGQECNKCTIASGIQDNTTQINQYLLLDVCDATDPEERPMSCCMATHLLSEHSLTVCTDRKGIAMQKDMERSSMSTVSSHCDTVRLTYAAGRRGALTVDSIDLETVLSTRRKVQHVSSAPCHCCLCLDCPEI